MSEKILVAYFSASGTTRAAAQSLAKAIGADLYEIQPETPYTTADLNWSNKNSRSSIEMNDSTSRPAIKALNAGVANYDEILIGFPVWWYVAPTIINTFLESYDFAGKKVTLFATSGGSGIGNCEKNLQKQYPAIDWKPGKTLNSDSAIREFAESIG